MQNWYIGVFRLPEIPALPESEGIEFQTCYAGSKGGQHVNKTDSAVRAESECGQYANKKRTLRLLALKLAEHYQTALRQHTADAHKLLYQVERGNPRRVLRGKISANRPDGAGNAKGYLKFQVAFVV
ncbi:MULTISPECIES: peptide chain release factor-like protein [Eikenella]|uniref:Peptide chain release factor-like protein n=1 Tax=Eikenella exigua TaxID=2528037 RepID=A0AAX1F7Z9_9NEIS|nr:hypothetical protein A7P94_00780 [Eikenella sp. NML01-A-086]QED92184.1 peptide chain release factor-like protein [Eikenella exigua]